MISLLDSVAIFIAALFGQGLLASMVLWPIGEQKVSRTQWIVFCILSGAYWITVSGQWRPIFRMVTRWLH